MLEETCPEREVANSAHDLDVGLCVSPYMIVHGLYEDIKQNCYEKYIPHECKLKTSK